MSRSRALLVSMILSSAALVARGADPAMVTFTPERQEFKLPLADLKGIAPNLPADWSPYNFLVIEWRASSSERFQLEIFANDGEGGKEVMVAKRISPFQNAWVRASVPLEFFRKPAREGFDLAATFNKHRDSYWININFGGWGPCKNVTAIGFQMETPIGSGGKPPTIEIRSVSLAKEDPGDAVLDPKVVVDAFGQWKPVEWPGKAHSLEELKKAWDAEAASLQNAKSPFEQDKYGGFRDTIGPSKGYFRVAQGMDGRWWLFDPDGNRFFSTGFNGIGMASATVVSNRQDIFESFSITALAGATGGNFYGANLEKRYGDSVQAAWGQTTFKRLDAWGINTVAGFGGSPPSSITFNGRKKPYTIMLRNWGGRGGAGGAAGGNGAVIMGLPDVYSPDFEARVNATAQQQCALLKDDPYLLGYFVGNEPPWPGRESLLCDAILAGPETSLKARLIEALGPGDTPERRKAFAYEAFEHYLSLINAAVKIADPNHLNLGIRLGGEVPDEVIRACRGFDVCSINVYEFAIPAKTLDRFASLSGRPLIVGEFHIGTPERGMSGGLRQVANQTERGVAYQYYVENAAAHPAVLGTHWFQWVDQPATGRNDGENYNIGIIDVTDRPYEELAAALVRTHARLYEIHSGKLHPSQQKPKGASTAEIQLQHPVMIPPAH